MRQPPAVAAATGVPVAEVARATISAPIGWRVWRREFGLPATDAAATR